MTPRTEIESHQRMRFAGLAFLAALLIVGSALVQLSVKEPNSELTTVLLVYNRHGLTNIVGSALECLGYIALAAALFWLHRSAQARRPESRNLVRFAVAVGAVLGGVIAVADTVAISHIAHTFASQGNQGYPEAHRLTTNSSLLNILPLFGFLGTAILAIGVLLTSLTALRVGLVPRAVGYAGVVAGLLFFISGFGFLGLVIQAFWLGALAVTIAGRWPSGDPPAWEAGTAVPWPPTARQMAQQQRATQQRGGRRRVSDKEVLAAVKESNNPPPPNPAAGRAKRKRKHR